MYNCASKSSSLTMCIPALGVVVPKPNLLVLLSNVKPLSPPTTVSGFTCKLPVVLIRLLLVRLAVIAKPLLCM